MLIYPLVYITTHYTKSGYKSRLIPSPYSLFSNSRNFKNYNLYLLCCNNKSASRMRFWPVEDGTQFLQKWSRQVTLIIYVETCNHYRWF